MTNLLILHFLGGLRGWEIIIIAVVILLLFGGKKIPELMRGVGKGIRGFKEGLNDMSDEIKGKSDSSDDGKSDEAPKH